MSGSSAIPPKDRKIRSTLWVPPAERTARPILEAGLASADADMDTSSLDLLSEEIMRLVPGQVTVQPRFQNNAKLDNLRDMMGGLSEVIKVLSEKQAFLAEKQAVLAEKQAALAEKAAALDEKEAALNEMEDILSKMLDSVS